MKIVEYFADPVHWTKETLFRDKFGESCDSDDSELVSCCLYGAVLICYEPEEQDEILHRIANHLPKPDDYEMYNIDVITNFNDNQGYDAVFALVKELDI